MYEVRDQFNLSNKCHVKVPVLSKKLIDAGPSVAEFLPADVTLLTLIQKSGYWQGHINCGMGFWAIFVYKMIDFVSKTIK